MKPGLQKAIPAAIFAFLLSSAIVYGIRSLQQMDPVYDPSVTLVLAPFLMLYAFIWGMGGLDPRMSEHAHAPQESPVEGVAIVPVAETHDDHEHHDPYEEAAQQRPFRILTGQVWTIGTVVLLLAIGLIAFSQLPTGLRIDQSNDAFASASQSDPNATFALPFGAGEFQTSELTVFLGFIAFTLLSLLIFAGLLALAFYGLNQGVVNARAVRTTSIDDPQNDATPALRVMHAPLRLARGGLNLVGRGAGGLARGLKRGLPSFFGQR